MVPTPQSRTRSSFASGFVHNVHERQKQTESEMKRLILV